MKVKFFIHAPSDDSTLSDISTLPTIEWTYPVLPRYKEVVQIEALVGDLQFQNRFENSDKIVDEHFNLSLFCFAVCYINWNVVKGELIPIIHLEVLDDIIERELNELRTTR